MFADKTEFSWYVPKIKQDEEKIKESDKSLGLRFWKSRRSRALLLQIAVVLVIMVINLALTVVAFSRLRAQDGVGVIYEGDCTTVANLDQWLHLLIDLLSTGMLSASNYCMQLQAAPTRANINSAHKRNKWLDIGVPSLRNFVYIGGWRRFSWLLLVFSSVPIHLMRALPSFPFIVMAMHTDVG